MTISILTDNHPGALSPSEHGLSYLIEYDCGKLLFDTGQSDLYLKNAETMNISIENIDSVILSHGHFDHGDGLEHLSGGTLVCHPGCFRKRYRRTDHSYIGLKNTREELSGKFNVVTSLEPYRISENIIFLGEIPRITDFESSTTSFIFDDGTPDYVLDDSAVAFILPGGLFILTGCGHSGIVNTLEHAKKVTGIKKLYGIMGGFHLKENNLQTKKTIKYLKENKVKNVYPSHCTDLPALSAFYQSFGMSMVKTGDIYEF